MSKTKKNHFLFITFCLIFFFSNGQDFTSSIDKISKLKTVTFIDKRNPSRVPMILKKTYSIDTAAKDEPQIEVGLYAIINLVALDYFMQKGGSIVFEDNASIELDEELSNIFLSGGKHQIAIKHIITASELRELQSKKIDYFLLGSIKTQIDRFEKEFIRTVFIKIEAE